MHSSHKISVLGRTQCATDFNSSHYKPFSYDTPLWALLLCCCKAKGFGHTHVLLVSMQSIPSTAIDFTFFRPMLVLQYRGMKLVRLVTPNNI